MKLITHHFQSKGQSSFVSNPKIRGEVSDLPAVHSHPQEDESEFLTAQRDAWK